MTTQGGRGTVAAWLSGLLFISTGASAADGQSADNPPPVSRPLTPRVEPVDDGTTDGLYGRLDGDLDLGLSLGAEFNQDLAWPQVTATAHYYATVGVRVSYADAFSTSASNQRVLAAGVELKPLFLPRWSANSEAGPAFLDLLIDSLGFGVGAYWDQPAGVDFGDRRGLELSVGLGAPLCSSARGAWVVFRGLGRFTDGSEPGDYGAVSVALSWHELFATGLAE